MTKTVISDMQLPANWNKYISLETTTKSVFFSSGAVVNNPKVAITAGGKTVAMPHINPLSGAVQYLDDANPLAVNKISTGKTTAVVHARAQAFAHNDLVGGYAGTDPLAHVASQWGTYWAGVFDDQAIATAKGVTAAAGTALTYDISGGAGAAAVFSASAFIDANHKLQDARAKLSAFVCHSDVVALMEKLDLIAYVKDSAGNDIATYRGKRIIESDKLAPATGVYTGFLIGNGAFGFAEGMDLQETENARDALASDSIQITRRSYVLHPNGFDYVGSTAGSTTPNDTALATSGNWSKVYDTKLIPLVAFKFKIS